MKEEDKISKRRISIIISFFLFFLILSGGLLNASVVHANGGKMPVLDGYTKRRHFGYTESIEVNLSYLSDRFTLDFGRYELIYSIGDIIIISGILLSFLNLGNLIYSEIKWGRPKNDKTTQSII